MRILYGVEVRRIKIIDIMLNLVTDLFAARNLLSLLNVGLLKHFGSYLSFIEKPMTSLMHIFDQLYNKNMNYYDKSLPNKNKNTITFWKTDSTFRAVREETSA